MKELNKSTSTAIRHADPVRRAEALAPSLALLKRGADLHTVQLFLDHANISTSSRYLKPSKLALHTTIQRIDAQRRASGEAAKWEQELAEMKKNLRDVPQKCHKLVESSEKRDVERPATAR